MTDLRDSKLTAAQLNVLVELNSTGKLPKRVQPRTIEILREGKFIDVVRVGEEETTYVLRTEGKKEIGIEVPSFHEKLMEDVAELEALLEPVGTYVDEPLADWERELLYPALTTPEEVKEDQEEAWKSYSENIRQWGDDITADEPYLEFAETFNHKSPQWEIELLGFEETLKWKNTKVWDGLTAKEIRDDMDTRVPANRKDKRAARKADRKARKALLDMIAS